MNLFNSEIESKASNGQFLKYTQMLKSNYKTIHIYLNRLLLFTIKTRRQIIFSLGLNTVNKKLKPNHK